ncbi:MAG: hypothetical protein SFZ03_08300 [Candidatus Melainabacteria bacterium]|nr:hypothetical protein [Candidatus Melainabacteria bacterium]
MTAYHNTFHVFHGRGWQRANGGKSIAPQRRYLAMFGPKTVLVALGLVVTLSFACHSWAETVSFPPEITLGEDSPVKSLSLESTIKHAASQARDPQARGQQAPLEKNWVKGAPPQADTSSSTQSANTHSGVPSVGSTPQHTSSPLTQTGQKGNQPAPVVRPVARPVAQWGNSSHPKSNSKSKSSPSAHSNRPSRPGSHRTQAGTSPIHPSLTTEENSSKTAPLQPTPPKTVLEAPTPRTLPLEPENIPLHSVIKPQDSLEKTLDNGQLTRLALGLAVVLGIIWLMFKKLIPVWLQRYPQLQNVLSAKSHKNAPLVVAPSSATGPAPDFSNALSAESLRAEAAESSLLPNIANKPKQQNAFSSWLRVYMSPTRRQDESSAPENAEAPTSERTNTLGSHISGSHATGRHSISNNRTQHSPETHAANSRETGVQLRGSVALSAEQTLHVVDVDGRQLLIAESATGLSLLANAPIPEENALFTATSLPGNIEQRNAWPTTRLEINHSQATERDTSPSRLTTLAEQGQRARAINQREEHEENWDELCLSDYEERF